ncbi:MAG: hypothetical protein P9X27_06230 [Candidatus Kaelpia aquatica]|nr:hypothetical protein [Candidatus Kaelpia aquatica]
MFKKILIFILILVITSGIGTGYFFLYQEKEREVMLRKDVEADLDLMQKDKQKIKEDLSKIKDDYQKITQELEKKIVKNEELSNEIGRLVDNLDGAKSEIIILSQERGVLLGRLEEQKAKLEKYQSKLKDEIPKLVEREPIVEDDNVQLENITVEEILPEAKPLLESKVVQIEAEIMAFNKEYGFIVLNKGVKDGVEIDSVYKFNIQGQLKGELNPDRVYDSMAVLDILEGRDNIAEGMNIEIFLKE